MRAFTFVDTVHEVTHHFTPGGDVVEVMENLAASAAHAALWGRTNYGRAFTKFAEEHADALGPKTSLLILGDARSNYSDWRCPVLRPRGRRAACVVAQPRAPAPLGHGRQRGAGLRRDRADGGVPQPDPARGVRVCHLDGHSAREVAELPGCA
ncbi:VWA domain-containing protein [Nocardioides sp. B-3]|uniref:VWA domain-containing protein n=1 Tax=Nocardioides sp. B-3 TaxID=2895565 RepID=UPI002153131A|nr:VWA domain-containing protein [Nocardioides sp. B-3]